MANEIHVSQFGFEYVGADTGVPVRVSAFGVEYAVAYASTSFARVSQFGFEYIYNRTDTPVQMSQFGMEYLVTLNGPCYGNFRCPPDMAEVFGCAAPMISSMSTAGSLCGNS